MGHDFHHIILYNDLIHWTKVRKWTSLIIWFESPMEMDKHHFWTLSLHGMHNYTILLDIAMAICEIRSLHVGSPIEADLHLFWPFCSTLPIGFRLDIFKLKTVYKKAFSDKLRYWVCLCYCKFYLYKNYRWCCISRYELGRGLRIACFSTCFIIWCDNYFYHFVLCYILKT